MRWHPARTSTADIAPEYETIRWRHRDQPDVPLEAGAQRINLEQQIPLTPDGIADPDLHAVNQRIHEAIRQTEAALTRENLYADTAGLEVEVIIRISGKAWPHIPGLTAPA